MEPVSVQQYPAEYVEMRGPWPVYICGMFAVQLPGKPRSISVDDAREVARKIQ